MGFCLIDRRAKQQEGFNGDDARQNDAALALGSQETDLIGLALTGFSDKQNHLWRSTCADVMNRLNNPYLRVMFKFLTCSRRVGSGIKDFKEILVSFGTSYGLNVVFEGPHYYAHDT